MKHLPATTAEFQQTHWDAPDFTFVFGEAYVDHPSFGHAVISRVLEDAGFRVAMIPLPDWRSVESTQCYPKPRLGFLVSAGNIDSMVNHYTAARKRRSRDVYAPNAEAGHRPDRATIAYSNIIRQAYKDVPIIIGGIEASLRRFAHYDYWDNKVRRSILEDAGADLLIYGMGERTIIQLARLLDRGVPIQSIHNIPGTCYLSNDPPDGMDILPDYQEVSTDKTIYALAFHTQYIHQDPHQGKALVQKQHRKYLVQNPPAQPLSRKELDRVYDLSYTRTAHPMYGPQGIAALNEVEFSLISSRGCFGACNFCALTYHQGRNVVSRSHASIIKEARHLTRMKSFKGYIHDVGGPTANFRHASCAKQQQHGACPDRQCLFPKPCKSLTIDHQDYMRLLRQLRGLDGVKKVFVRSGIRFDYLMADKDHKAVLREIVKHHISGRLKIAPEHVSPHVLRAMGKPNKDVYLQFTRLYNQLNQQTGMQQHIEPYYISSHPGSDLHAAIELACTMRDMNIAPEQVQDFYPTPATVSTCMYYTGLDPRTMQPIHVPKGDEKKMQRALLQYRKKPNHVWVRKALQRAGRTDLIGYDRHCLVPPATNRDSKPSGKQPLKSRSHSQSKKSHRKPRRKR